MNYISIIKNLLVIYFIISFCYGKDPLFTELSNDQISINAGFTGAKLVLFGSNNPDIDDITLYCYIQVYP